MGTGFAIASAGASLTSAVGGYNASKSEARRLKSEAEQKMMQRREQIQKLVAEQKIGYGQAGVELEGSAQAVIQDTYNTGIEDVNAIASAYNKAIKGVITQAKANLIGSLAGTAVKTYSLYNKRQPLYGATGDDTSIWDSLTSWDWKSNPFATREPYTMVGEADGAEINDWYGYQAEEWIKE